MRHFAKHKRDFGVATADEYEQLADEFLGGPLKGTMLEGEAKHGGKIRYDTKDDVFGALTEDGRIKTYFKPKPAEHGAASNLEYFKRQRK